MAVPNFQSGNTMTPPSDAFLRLAAVAQAAAEELRRGQEAIQFLTVIMAADMQEWNREMNNCYLNWPG